MAVRTSVSLTRAGPSHPASRSSTGEGAGPCPRAGKRQGGRSGRRGSGARRGALCLSASTASRDGASASRHAGHGHSASAHGGHSGAGRVAASSPAHRPRPSRRRDRGSIPFKAARVESVRHPGLAAAATTEGRGIASASSQKPAHRRRSRAVAVAAREAASPLAISQISAQAKAAARSGHWKAGGGPAARAAP
jgi:hypothetical protein